MVWPVIVPEHCASGIVPSCIVCPVLSEQRQLLAVEEVVGCPVHTRADVLVGCDVMWWDVFPGRGGGVQWNKAA